MVSTSAIASVCGTRKDVVRFVMKEVMESISKLLIHHTHSKMTLNLGIGKLVISHHTLHFEPKLVTINETETTVASSV